jgi:hypothetical protein
MSIVPSKMLPEGYRRLAEAFAGGLPTTFSQDFVIAQ